MGQGFEEAYGPGQTGGLERSSIVDIYNRMTSTCLLPIIPAWDFTLKKWMGDGDWRISLAMD
jgi:hypothetical protein